MFKLVRVMVIVFFLSINWGALLYINSTFLGRFFSPSMVSLLFLAGAAGNVALFLATPRLLNAFSRHRLLMFSIISTLLGTLGLAFATSGFSAALAFLIYGSFFLMNYYCLDIILEEQTGNEHTGEIRGIHFTFLNAGIALGPLLVALLASDGSLKPLYLLAAFLLIPPLFLSFFSFKKSDDQTAHLRKPSLPFKKWWHSPDLRRATLARFSLETFFAFMVIYTPLYLHGRLGFTWPELGVIFTVALLPFVFFELPVGELADRFLGEKEIMSLGFFITGLSLLFMPFVGYGFLTWMFLLFLSRVGASFIEITTESYFFKHIDSSETGLLSIFRLSRPVSVIFGAILGTFTLHFFSMEKLFFVLAVIIFLGLRESLYMRDTR